MRWRQTTLSPWLRSFAAIALLAFVLAQAMCFVHCHFRRGPVAQGQPSCHGSPQHAASPDGEPGSTPSVPRPTATCSTLKTMLAWSESPTLAAFQPHTLYVLSPVVLALDATVTRLEASFVRQAHSRGWTFTPEVCLGPAFRSLAPPFLG